MSKFRRNDYLLNKLSKNTRIISFSVGHKFWTSVCFLLSSAAISDIFEVFGKKRAMVDYQG